MRRESHVRFCEGLRGRFPRATRLASRLRGSLDYYKDKDFMLWDKF